MELEEAGTYRKLANRVTHGVHFIGMVAIVGMTVLVVTDVIMRYAFNSPIMGSLEVLRVLHLIIVFAGLAYTQARKQHIHVDFITSRLSRPAVAIVQSITWSLAAGLLSLIVWQGIIHGTNMLERGERSADLRFFFFPVEFFLAFGSALLLAVIVIDLAESIRDAFRSNQLGGRIAVISGVLMAMAIPTAIVFRVLPWEISPAITGGISIFVLLIFLFSGMPVAFCLTLVGFLGMGYLLGIEPALALIRVVPFEEAISYSLIVVPLFVFMGELVGVSGMGKDLYFSVYKWIGNLPGGLAMATIGGCTGFAALVGSGVPTAATMGSIALPEMKRYKYDPALATGCVAAGGTLSVLIPPSLTFIIYAIITEQSIGRLFLAGVIPGIILATMMMLSIYFRCKLNINLGPRGPSTNWIDKLVSLKAIWPVVILFVLVIGGIYLGVFSPYEAGGIGAFGALLFTIGFRRLNPTNFTKALNKAVVITSFSIFMIIGASVAAPFLAVTRLPFNLASYVAALPIPPVAILGLIMVMYMILGCFMPNIPLMLLTIPLFFPVIMALGYDPIWFGVIVVILGETAVVTPPVGIVVYVVKGIAPDVPMSTIFRGVLPFILVDVMMLAILVVFPQVALFLPTLMKG